MISKCAKLCISCIQTQTEWYVCVRAGKGDSSIGRVILLVPGANG